MDSSIKNIVSYQEMKKFGALNFVDDQISALKPFACLYNSRLELDSHVDVYCTRWLFCGVCRPADLPALSSVLSGRVAAQRASERSGRGEPATGAGPRQPQPAAARTLPGYKPKEDAIAAFLARISVCSCDFCRSLVREPAVGWPRKTSCPTATRPV